MAKYLEGRLAGVEFDFEAILDFSLLHLWSINQGFSTHVLCPASNNKSQKLLLSKALLALLRSIPCPGTLASVTSASCCGPDRVTLNLNSGPLASLLHIFHYYLGLLPIPLSSYSASAVQGYHKISRLRLHYNNKRSCQGKATPVWGPWLKPCWI